VNLTEPTEDLDDWIAIAVDELPPLARAVAKIVAFAHEPISPDVVAAIAAPLPTGPVIEDLVSRFLIGDDAGRLEMPGAVRDYVTSRTTDAEQADLAARFTDYYRQRARTVFLDGLGSDEPSYGTLYLESYPDQGHRQFVDDLFDRLVDHGYVLARNDPILVLGSGDGTYDRAFAKHVFAITDVGGQPEIVALGRAKASALPAVINYVVADITEPLPAEIADGSMAAVFNIGSLFGHESSDSANAMVFRNAARALRPGAPFVFEYVNGAHWRSNRRQVEVTSLANGATRTEVSITDPDARTSLTMIGLRRADGTGGWLRQFRHCYPLDEIIVMLAAAGLRVVATYGANAGRVTGKPFDERESESMVVIATR
jgi:SAM-dependent methyltransferase